ncbi:PREDICTED: E3 ubiquitin-protein ligase RNF25-like, partial [Papilio polytes]|uniref:E3 ubiquitin-protein ligase RNF25-like n=1 Tax=Papilio polytes TaxID=76194 RepID=UPI0006766FB2
IIYAKSVASFYSQLIRENLTECNLPSGQCVICLFGFEAGDVFIKTQCYHHFHSHCLANHLISGKKYYKEEMDKLPNWQQVEAPPYQPCCPVCRCVLSFDADTLKKAPPPVGSINAAPFRVTPEMLALQRKMSLLLARQIRRGGVVGSSSPGPRPLTITTAADAVTNGSSQASQEGKSEVADGQLPGNASNAGSEPGSPQGQGYRGPYR